MDYESKKEDIIMFFDTETSGLSSKGVHPYILQLSYILYDTKKNTIIKTKNYYIKIADNIVIDEKAQNVHGITTEMLKNGIEIEFALKEFYNSYMNCSKIIGHNIKFDIQMIKIEIERNINKLKELGCLTPENVFNIEFEKENNIQCICTMYNTIDYCNIQKESIKEGRPSYFYKKYPKLSELYMKLFHEEATNLHDSLEDVKVCMKCYFELIEKNIVDFTKKIPQ